MLRDDISLQLKAAVITKIALCYNCLMTNTELGTIGSSYNYIKHQFMHMRYVKQEGLTQSASSPSYVKGRYILCSQFSTVLPVAAQRIGSDMSTSIRLKLITCNIDSTVECTCVVPPLVVDNELGRQHTIGIVFLGIYQHCLGQPKAREHAEMHTEFHFI